MAVANPHAPSRPLRTSWSTARDATSPCGFLPFLFLLYITNYLDRTSVAYAAIGMSRDLGFSDRVFGLGAGIFFISYVALQIPGALLVEAWGARRVICVTMIAWGSPDGADGTRAYSDAALRGALRARRGGSRFFPRRHHISEPLVHSRRSREGHEQLHRRDSHLVRHWFANRRLDSWPQLVRHRRLAMAFLPGRAPAILLWHHCVFYLTDFPGEAAWLAAEQRDWIDRKLGEEKSVKAQAMPIWQALRSRATLLLAAVCFLNYFVIYCFMFWFPTLLKRQSGFSGRKRGPAWRCAVCGDVRRDAGQRVAFRQKSRKTLALRRAVSCRGGGTAGPPRSPRVDFVVTSYFLRWWVCAFRVFRRSGRSLPKSWTNRRQRLQWE